MPLVNGKASTQISLNNRGLHYGDGLFETIKIDNGQPLRWQQHMRRLQAGSERLGFTPVDTNLLRDEALQLCTNEQHAVLKIIITRGAAKRGYRPSQGLPCTRILELHPLHPYPAHYFTQGVALRWCTTRLGCNPLLAGLKHLNRLEQVMARDEWYEADIFEGIMQDINGHVIEGTMSNLFIVRESQLLTPDLSACGVAGVVREQVLQIAQRLAIPLSVTTVTVQDLLRADELFITNALIGLLPVRKLEETLYPSASDAQSLTRRIANAMNCE
ncbi:MAG: aminodeoxychorismate lyase [Gammaproteobacteria bacterium]|nr:aminodeoxychorismate lyase [Gammaproteobacteria bacterium]